MVNKISHTAAYIAVKFYGLTLNPKIGTKFDPFLLTFYKNIVEFLPKHLSWNLKALKSQRWRNFFVRWEELLLPGDLMHIISRKYYIHELIQAKIFKDMDTQIVILGFGFDHSGAYWSKQGIHCFEIDTQEMCNQKSKFLTEFNYSNNHLHVISIKEQEQNINQLLMDQPDFNPKKHTLFIAEGFFDYLTLKHTQSILYQISEFKRSTLISTMFDLSELNFFHRFMFTSGVAMVGESLKLPLNRTQYLQLLSDSGFSLRNEISYKQAKEEFIDYLNLKIDLPVLNGFYIIDSDR